MARIFIPDRGPDVVLPEYLEWAEVRIWINESIFWLNNTYHSSISSVSMEMYDCTDPILYLKRVAEYGRDNPRKAIASEFLESLDNILLGIE